MYDIIADIHGHAAALKALLKKMDYRLRDGVWHHPERKAVFVGDYIDRGPAIRETLQIVRSMTAAGSALAIMGNHEYNALAFKYHSPDGGHIRPHTMKNLLQHYETIRQFRDHEEEWDDYLAWMANLPLFLELEGLRVVHACWNQTAIDYIKSLPPGPITRERLIESHRKGTEAWFAHETILKGPELKLPDGHFFIDKDGHVRTECRIRWWLRPDGLDLKDYLMHAPDSVRGYPLPEELLEDTYPADAPPVFFGHYWLDYANDAALMSPNCCCLDYSVAKDGPLLAYRFEPDQLLSNSEFCIVH